MGRRDLIAIASSDWHYHNWKQFNENGERLTVTKKVILKLFEEAHLKKVPILFSGDLFHTPDGLSDEVFYSVMDFFKGLQDLFNDVRVLGISGNHDGKISMYKAISRAFDNFICIDNGVEYINNIPIIGIPYIKRNKGLVDKIEKAKEFGGGILLLHTELYGAPDPSGYTVEPQNLPRNLNALFKAFDLVLSGHIHKHTKVCDNVYMVGAPNQQRKSDAGCKMGYLKIYSDFSVKFVDLGMPEFKYYNEGEKRENTDDFWIEIPKPKKLKKSSEASFKPNMDKTKMAKKYANETGIKSPKKVNALIKILNKTEE